MTYVKCYDESKVWGNLLLVVVNGNEINRYLFDDGFSKRMLIDNNDSPGIVLDVSTIPVKFVGYFNFGNWEIKGDEFGPDLYLRDKYKKVVQFNYRELIESQTEISLFSYLRYESFKEANGAFIEKLKEKYKIPDSIICRFFKWLRGKKGR